MPDQFTLSFSGQQYAALRRHLFPSDGFEAVAVVLCAHRRGSARHRLLARKVVLVPYENCSVRTPSLVTWSTDFLPPLLVEAAKNGWSLLKIHGHLAFRSFSATDDRSDRILFPSVHAWADGPHASAIMMSDGAIFGRVVGADGQFTSIDRVSVADDDIAIWDAANDAALPTPEYGRRVAQSFGKGTFDLLRKLKVGVVGCSGTGSPVIEMLARNCVGELVLVDPDVIEDRNLNRILNSTAEHARQATPKVDVAERAIAATEMGTAVRRYQRMLFDREVVHELADCDVLFGCMDSVDGRHLLNKIATYYCIPYFDLGVKIVADGQGGVDQVCGTVHYLKPGGSSLFSRRVYSMEQVRAAGLARTDPVTYADNVAAGYIQGVQEDRPAVIQLNMLIASLAINEFLARLHPYRIEDNGQFATHRISLSHGIYEHEPDGEPCAAISRHVGRGDVEPLLDWPELSSSKEVA